MLRASLPFLLACTALLVPGCGRAREEPRAAEAGPGPKAGDAPRPTLYGSWAIVEIKGSPPLRLGPDAPTPGLVFAPSHYSGSTGCNSFWGTGLLVSSRWYGELPMATEQGCGPLTDQERAIFDIVAGGPAAAFEGQDEVRLTSGAGSLRLRRQSDEDPEGPASEPMLLAGTAWEVSRIDGRPVGELNRRERARLTFEADRWTLDAGCAPLSGPWRQAGRTVTMKAVSSQPSSCSPLLKAEDSAIREMFAAAPQFVVGANREFVMAGGNHWMSAMFDRRLPSGAELLRGEWRIEAVDGAVPAAMPRPPSLIFGDSSYAIWDGCNHSEGIMLAVARQLFTRGSGVTTLASCVPDPLRSRIGAVLGNNPRIAKTDDRGLALVASTGTLRLTRLSERTFGRGEQLGLRAPRAIELLAPKGRLMLQSGNRFAISLDCGRIEGEWRGGQPARFSSGPLERTAPNCDTRPGSNAFRLGQFFTGNVLAITGPNRDIVLVVNEDRSIAGRVAE